MPELSRTQVLVYGAIAVALLLVGARAIRAEGGGESGTAHGVPLGSSATLLPDRAPRCRIVLQPHVSP